MDKWEYHYLPCDPRSSDCDGTLNEWGKEGWEAVGTATPILGTTYVLFKRNLLYSKSPEGEEARRQAEQP